MCIRDSWYPIAFIVTSAFGIASCEYKTLNDGTAITIKIKQGTNVQTISTKTLCVLLDGLGFLEILIHLKEHIGF